VTDDAAPVPGAISRAGVLGTAAGALAFDEVQPEAKRVMDARAWLAGVPGDAHVDPRIDP
jgi:hypothetical protein